MWTRVCVHIHTQTHMRFGRGKEGQFLVDISHVFNNGPSFHEAPAATVEAVVTATSLKGSTVSPATG